MIVAQACGRVIEVRGERLTVGEWAARLRCTPAAIYCRLRRHGWDEERAVTEPVLSPRERARIGGVGVRKPAPAPEPPAGEPGFIKGSEVRRESCRRYRQCLFRAARTPVISTAASSGCPHECIGYEPRERQDATTMLRQP